MDINKTNAIKLWDERYGKQTQKATDFSGRLMTKGQYGKTDSKTGWTIDHRQPLANGGSNVKCNLEIVNHKTNAEKANKITFTANEKQFQVQSDGSVNSGCYKIVELKSESSPNSKVKLNSRRDFAVKLFKDTIEDDLDIAGRYINIDSFETDDEGAWSIGYFNTIEKLSVENCFVAHLETLNDQKGKTSFKSNDMVFELKKNDGKYHYINSSKIVDSNDYLNVLGYTSNLFKQERTIYKDLITLKIIFENDADFSKLIILLEEILSVGSLRSNLIVPNTYLGMGFKERKVHIIYDTPKENHTCIAHEFAMYMNTLKSFLIKLSSIREITIYHSTHIINAKDYLGFINNIELHFVSKVRRNQVNTIYLTEDVKNYLTKCKYKDESFTKPSTYESYYERNYIFTELLNLIKNF